MSKTNNILVRNTRPEDFAQIIGLSEAVYPGSVPWSETQLASHLNVFPDGQFVAVEQESQRIIGMASSLIVWWNDYEMTASWRDFTGGGLFTNHDPEHGRTLYGAEIMVHPLLQGGGIGKKLYAARRTLTERLGLLRIRAGARLRYFHKYAEQMSAEQYAIQVVHGELCDPTLTFQLRQGFDVLAVVSNYLRHDPESLGYAAVIEWLNRAVATPADEAGRDPRFISRQVASSRTH